MRYIDKYRMHSSAHALNVRFLKFLYRKNIANPEPSPADSERSFKSFKRYKNDWIPLLLQEQLYEGASRCCFCMRKLVDSAGLINIEHVIPKSLSGLEGQTQYAYYSTFAPALRDHIMMADDFGRKTFNELNDINNESHLPHTIGLSNLVAACNGKRNSFNTIGCCCNWLRSSDKIMPIMLMPNADTDVKYDANGILTISCNDGSLNKIIDELNDTTLQEIRSIWYHLSRVEKDLTDALNMPILERINWFKEGYATTNFATLPTNVKRYIGALTARDSDTYWELLLAYDWFYFYPSYAKQRN